MTLHIKESCRISTKSVEADSKEEARSKLQGLSTTDDRWYDWRLSSNWDTRSNGTEL